MTNTILTDHSHQICIKDLEACLNKIDQAISALSMLSDRILEYDNQSLSYEKHKIYCIISLSICSLKQAIKSLPDL